MDVDATRIWRYWPSLCLAALILGTAWAGGASAEVSLRVDARPVADPIEAFVGVTDANGRPVAGLGAGDFQLLVDGTAVSSPTFSLPPSQGDGKVSVVLAMDKSQTVKQAADDAMREAVTDFINSMQVGDYAAVVMFNETNPAKASVVQPFTQIDAGAGNSALVSAANSPYQGSGSNILDGVKLSIDQLRSPPVTLPEGPKTVLVVSDGRDNASTSTLADVIAAANQAGVSVFAVGVGNVNGTLMQDLASGTGGQYLAAPTAGQIADAYARIADQLKNEYLLTFTSSISDCNSHTLEVRVAGQSPASSNFTRCDAAAPPPTGGGGDGGGGDDSGGGGGTGWAEVLAGLAVVAAARRLRRRGQAGG